MRINGLLLAGCLGLTSGCSDSTAPGDVFGGYGLLTINGQLLPFTTVESSSSRQVTTSGGLMIGMDGEGKFSETVHVITYTKPGGAVSSEQDLIESGSYVVSGKSLTLTFPDRSPANRTIVATVDRDRITFRTPSNLTVVYQKFRI